MTDYAIARRIINLHSKQQESIDRIYSMVRTDINDEKSKIRTPQFCLSFSQDEIQRYVTFARQFKPKINADSSEYMVEEYKRLRQRDSSGQWVNVVI